MLLQFSLSAKRLYSKSMVFEYSLRAQFSLTWRSVLWYFFIYRGDMDMGMKCPGAGLTRQPEPEAFNCPSCGYEVEIWTDEFSRPCRKCGTIVTKSEGLSCVQWCRHAQECIGEARYTQYMARRVSSLRERLLAALEDRLRPIDRRAVPKEVSRTVRSIRYAEKIIALEGGDPHIVIPAVVLYEIGRADGAAAGTAAIRKILLSEGLLMAHIDEICEIVSSLERASSEDTLNLRIVRDALLLMRLEETRKKSLKTEFRTAAGRTLAALPDGLR